MIESFLASWDLFANTYLAGWLIGALLALVGVLVVARDQIFVGAAITEASTLGIAVAIWLATRVPEASWIASDTFASVSAVVFSILAAIVTARGGGPGEETHEAITGWVFLFSASGAILLLAHNPHGLEEIHRLLASSIIGATPTDVAIFAVLLALTAAFVALNVWRLLLFVMDPPMAAAVGLRVPWWSALLAVWLGLVVGLSIRVSGMLYTFGSLVLPALIAKSFCREVRSMFVVAPLVSIGSGIAAFVLAHAHDDPPAQMAVALLSGLLVLGWGLGRLR